MSSFLASGDEADHADSRWSTGPVYSYDKQPSSGAPREAAVISKRTFQMRNDLAQFVH
jgi:hypothetical protein